MRAIANQAPHLRHMKRHAAVIARELLSSLPEIEARELGRPHSRRHNPIMAGFLEGITQALYDVYALASNTAAIKLTLFALPQGQVYNVGGVTAFTKTAGHTSQLLAGVLQSPNKHIVRAISVFTEGNTVGNDLEKFLECFFQFNVNGKSYQDTIVGRIPAGGGSFAAMMGTFVATNGYSLTANGWPDARNTYTLAYGGVPIEQQQQFNCIIDPTISNVTAAAFTSANTVSAPGTPIAGVGIFAHIFLDGTLFRAVQ
ncbi:MAG TPA: hypothetical protein VKW06_10400 [Candidatus Angelobacter sp.]|nr:hypothetical protein [Candidatus Angelobacter sp.]